MLAVVVFAAAPAFAQGQAPNRRDVVEAVSAADPARFDRFSLQVGDVLLDYSKNRITDETMKLLVRLAEEAVLTQEELDRFNNPDRLPLFITATR